MSVDLAKVSPSDLDTAREIMHRRLIDSQEFHSCLNCDHWRPNGDSKAADECGLYNMRPPAAVIVFSCDNWCPDIPF